jgi:aryl-alcohol dehydrogenase-like predicted oxidoreductase
VQTKPLGRDGPELSVVGFGAWEAGKGSEWGEPPADEQILDAIRTVLDTDMSWIDTAEVYGRGTSEEFVGRAIGSNRDDVVIATKVAPKPAGSGFRPEQVAEACRGSLKRLGIDHIDLYQLHWPDESGIPVEDTWGAMALLVEQGLVRFAGVSNFDRELIERCLPIRHVDSLQQEFSMLVLEDRELIAWCGEQGIGVLAYGPLAYGLLAGTITMETTFGPGDFRGQPGEEAWDALFSPEARRPSLDVVEGLRPLAEQHGCSVSQLVLAWTFHQPGVTGAIAGSRNPDHVRENADAGDVVLDAEALSELETVLERGPSFAG